MFADGALDGRVALVTGGGTNLGKAAAAELARCGASVVIAGRRQDVLEEASTEIGERCSWVVRRHPRRATAPSRSSAAVLERHGRLDFLLNNAGGQYFVPAEAIATKGWRAVQRLNVAGTLAMCRAAHELAMRPAGSGTIVNVTVSPHHGIPGDGPHRRGAGGGRGHHPRARGQLVARRRDGDRDRARPVRDRVAAQVPRRAMAKAAASVPLQRLGTLEEYGWLVALLASPLGAAFSGSVVTLDGALDNWPGPWPPPDLTRDGEVPTEERRPVA